MYEKLENCTCPQYPEKGDHLESCKYFATKTRAVKAFSKPRKVGPQNNPDENFYNIICKNLKSMRKL